jgi:topoisomerase-4 subunit A
LVTKFGKAKRVLLKDFEVNRHSKAFKAIKLDPTDKLVNVDVSNGYKQIIIITDNAKAVRYAETNISIYGPNSKGVKAINLAPNTFVSSFVMVDNDDVIGLLSKRGGIKRIKVANVMPMGKGTQGKHLYNLLKTNPHVILDTQVVKPNDRALFKTSHNLLQIFEIKEADITNNLAGFSSIASNQIINAKILINKDLSAKSSLFAPRDILSEEQKFAEAEKELENISQLSIDDLLKDL